MLLGIGSIAFSGYSDQIGPYDELALKNNYQLLLKDQGRWAEAGYVEGLDWATTQRQMWAGIVVGEAGGLVGSQFTNIIRNSIKSADLEGKALSKRVLAASADADSEAGGFSRYDEFRKNGEEFKPDGNWNWPSNLGFAEAHVDDVLPVGTKLDRYGSPDGAFLSPFGTPYEQRALAPGSRGNGYHEYEVIKPLPVIKGEIAPAFGQTGGGTQILPRFKDRVNVDWLRLNGFLKEVGKSERQSE
ncbi:DUF4237 domain-containing protein [Xanthomonas citri pv. punicae]|uniref:TNT domain-containing protein n=1 Tax=Xanthomonas citri TaxID=346 RepID=UPI000247CFDB|nr:TNT domain-containing protein [Xanthomonas citri]MBE0314128.1 TNT domain-containing protein [Xanthomonas citri pv. punicae]MDS0837045.1 TNT domain-containing protein [Xanthomonas citri pv. punicae]QCZ64314.1 DUF4237 domain-containing protein [Xanthomonas citri pv. punicae]QCZ68014.1 DUF4237 domain-containing protein [Xanthomonas citri pv. punicae]QCZ74577.1 DUF4237 domain-containing protein [Xanthomonas citri pv. punicae]